MIVITAHQGDSKKTTMMLCCVLLLFSGGAEAQTLPTETDDPNFWQSETTREGGLSANDMVRLCGSAHGSNVEFCEGYLDYVTSWLRYQAACSSELLGEQYFCAASAAASDDFDTAADDCPGCSRAEIVAMLDVCTPDAQRDEQFCTVYNTEISTLSAVAFPDDQQPDASPREQGWYWASAHLVVSFWRDADRLVRTADSNLFNLPRCISSTTTMQELRDALARFVEENPAERQADALVALARAQFEYFCRDPLSGIRPHVEVCIELRVLPGQSVSNTCDEPVLLQIKKGSEPAVERTLNPGETFASDSGFIWTACPVGYRSAVPLEDGYLEEIRSSLYGCIANESYE